MDEPLTPQEIEQDELDEMAAYDPDWLSKCVVVSENDEKEKR